MDVIIDTDPGCDDALAIMFAVRCGRFRIRALTTVCGNGPIELVTKNARYVLDALGKPEIPVFSGAKTPLNAQWQPAVVHGESCLGRIVAPGEIELTNDAVERMNEFLCAEPGRISIVALGPLTNLANLIERFPGAIEKAKKVIILGGAVRPPGNKGRVAEFNFWVDPEAAKRVIEHAFSKTLITLDACFQVVLQREDFLGIRDEASRTMALDLMEPYIEANEAEEGIRGAIMYDPLALHFLVNPKAATVVEHDVVVETQGDFTRGMLVADLRAVPNKKHNVSVVERIDPAVFRADLIQGINQEL